MRRRNDEHLESEERRTDSRTRGSTWGDAAMVVGAAAHGCPARARWDADREPRLQPEGTQIASGGADGSLKLWDLANGGVTTLESRPNGPRPNIMTADFQPRWSTGCRRRARPRHRPGPGSTVGQSVQQLNVGCGLSGVTIAFSPDVARARFVTGSGTRNLDCLQFWMRRKQQVGRNRCAGRTCSGSISLSSVRMGGYVVSGHSDGSILLWDDRFRPATGPEYEQ